MTMATQLRSIATRGIAGPARAFGTQDQGPPLIRSHNLDDESVEPLAHFAREMNRELQGDGLLVTWYDGTTDPLILFAEGDCTPLSAEERDMAEMSLAVARQPSSGARSQWRVRGEVAESALLTTSIPADGGIVTITTLFKRIGHAARIRASDTAARLLPLVQPFFKMWTLRLRTLGRVRALTSALDNTDVGILLVDAQGEVTFANNVAQSMLAHNDGLRRKGNSLFGARLADTMRLQAALEHAISPHPNQIGKPVAPVVALHRANGRPLLAAIVPADGQPDVVGSSAAVLYVVDPDQDLRPVVEPACKYYGLSPVETRLACMLANGSSLADSAKAMHVTEQTARSYLKQIFVKTETNRQAELVRLMLTSSVRTAPHSRASFV
ncbi:helix-turn-helix transcriptional regulator [uncultured Sphingomonas sp.]|uniref:helix-turn-helix transcriptional regulator n=1 Tax=uncultured Sphingomonas sp. TaxID=158754 RepID=UPI0035CC23C2